MYGKLLWAKTKVEIVEVTAKKTAKLANLQEFIRLEIPFVITPPGWNIIETMGQAYFTDQLLMGLRSQLKREGLHYNKNFDWLTTNFNELPFESFSALTYTAKYIIPNPFMDMKIGYQNFKTKLENRRGSPK